MSRSADSLLRTLGPRVGTEVELDTLVAEAIDAVADRVGAPRVALFLVDRARQELVLRAGRLPELTELVVPLHRGIAGHVARTGASVRVEDASRDPRFWADVDRRTGLQTKALIAAPMRDERGRVLGVVEALNKRGGFTAEDLSVLQRVAADLAQLLERTSLVGQLRAPARVPRTHRYNGILGCGDAMERVHRTVAKAARTDATVLIRGETGTGKGLIARAIHVNGPRRDGPFVAVDCATIPAGLIESELFGHERGAFTGAHRRAIGRFEAAHEGTVFIDEIGELPLALQGRLLRVLQERRFERVGGRKTVEVDIRVIAATHRDLEDMVARQLFREDLYYRLRVVPLVVPALRDRGREDLEMLAHHFTRLYATRHHRPELVLSESAMAVLARHDWPGNVRELENCIESATVLAEGPAIEAADLPLPDRIAVSRSTETEGLAGWTWAQMQRRYIDAVMQAHGGNQSAAARAMGIGRSTLLRKLAGR